MAGPGTNGTAKKTRADWTPKFLDRLREHGNITAAAEAVGVGKTTIYRRRNDNQAFAAQMAEALEAAIDGLELEAYRRATRRNDPSDVLLIFLLKANRPEKYRERHDVRHMGGVTLGITEEIVDVPREEADHPAAPGSG